MTANPRLVTVVPTAGQLKGLVNPGDFCVVVDILRATTTITTALARGAKSVVPCASVEESRALAIRLQNQGEPVLLAGERGGRPLPGFDLGNSPLEYQESLVQGKTVVLTTTNGTQALDAGSQAGLLVAGCFGNAQAVSRIGVAWTGRIVVACAGQEGSPATEDLLFAGWLVDQWLESGFAADLNAQEARNLWRAETGPLGQRLSACPHGNTLIELGFALDVDFAAQWDTSRGIPRFIPDTNQGYLVGTMSDFPVERMFGA